MRYAWPIVIGLAAACSFVTSLAVCASNHAAAGPPPVSSQIRSLEKRLEAIERWADAMDRWQDRVDEKLWPKPKRKK